MEPFFDGEERFFSLLFEVLFVEDNGEKIEKSAQKSHSNITQKRCDQKLIIIMILSDTIPRVSFERSGFEVGEDFLLGVGVDFGHQGIQEKCNWEDEGNTF